MAVGIHGTLYPQNLALTSPTSGGRSVARGLRPRSLVFFFFLVNMETTGGFHSKISPFVEGVGLY
jgi:hypothetical protein